LCFFTPLTKSLNSTCLGLALLPGLRRADEDLHRGPRRSRSARSDPRLLRPPRHGGRRSADARSPRFLHRCSASIRRDRGRTPGTRSSRRIVRSAFNRGSLSDMSCAWRTPVAPGPASVAGRMRCGAGGSSSVQVRWRADQPARLSFWLAHIHDLAAAPAVEGSCRPPARRGPSAVTRCTDFGTMRSYTGVAHLRDELGAEDSRGGCRRCPGRGRRAAGALAVTSAQQRRRATEVLSPAAGAPPEPTATAGIAADLSIAPERPARPRP